MKATQSTSTRTERRGITRFGKWLGLFALVLAAAALLLIALPAKSSVTMTTCGRWGLACRADAHQGVISLLALVIAIGAAIFAYLSLHGDKVARRVAQVQSRAAEKQAEKSYRGLLNLMLYETVHNLRHLAEEVRWVASVPEYEGCRLDGWPDLRFRYTERLLEVPHVYRLEAELPAVIGFLDHALRNAQWIDRHAYSWKDLDVAQHYVWMTEHLLRVLACAGYRAPERISNDARRFLTAVLYEDALDPDPAEADEGPEIEGPEIEIRDRVRFVMLEGGTDERQCDTTVACFTPSGQETSLFEKLKCIPDPPPPLATGPVLSAPA